MSEIVSAVIGMPKKDAQNLAERMNMIFRLMSVDGKVFLGPPQDPGRDDRLCVELENGRVSKAEVQ